MNFRFNFILSAFVLLLGLSSCEPAGPTENIVDLASSNDNLSTLVAAVAAGGLVETLEGEGPFTVFAPDNTAFDNLPEGLLEALLKPENKEILSSILTYHVVSGNVKAADLIKAIEEGGGTHTFTTVNGGELSASVLGDNVVLTDASGNKATVTATDVEASNGVVHIINSVVVPGDVNPADLLGAGDIVAVASGNEDFSTLVAAVQAAGLVETLQGEGPFTVFAPVNAAFAKLPDGTLDNLLKPENRDALTGILTYHVVAGAIDSGSLVNAISEGDGKTIVETVNGGKLEATLEGESVIITDANGNKATVVAVDVAASNGVIHVIDTVVLPSS
jgi:transforming growth factor-beta-induced protein